MKEYALYKGDSLLSIGTIPEIAMDMGVKKETIEYYRTQAYKRKLKRRNAYNGNVRILIEIEDDLEEEAI